ncbi:MAG: hypothetical protein ABIP94_08615 [Planctomycetota bacterium]
MHRAPTTRLAVVRFALAWLFAVAIAGWCIADVWPFFVDDAFISLRYSDRLLAGNGLTWTDGEWVEGYSNLAWVVLCALLGSLGMGTDVAARVAGFACMATVLALIAWRFRRTPAAGVATVLAASAVFAPWTIGGLEMPLLALCTTGGLLACERAFESPAPRRALLVGGLCFAIAALTRPDAPLVPAVLATAWFVQAWAKRREGARPFSTVFVFLLPVGLAVSGQLVFRLAYYGDWMANSARVKVGDGAGLPREGLAYVAGAIVTMSGLWALALFGAAGGIRRRAGSSFVRALVTITVAWVGYLTAIGGDFFPAFRLVVPLLPVLALLAGLGLERLANVGRSRCLAALLLVLAAAIVCRVQARCHPEMGRVKEDVWALDGLAIGKLLGEAFAPADPLVAVDAAGAVPYGSRLRSLDMLGLCDADIARDPGRPPASTSFARAHRRGSPDYLFGRAPDVFLFGRAPGDLIPLDPAGRVLVDDPRFVADYRCVWLELPAAKRRAGAAGSLHTPLWLRVRGRCGVRTRTDGVDMSAMLFGSSAMLPGFRPEPPDDAQARAVWNRAVAQLLPWLSLSSVVVVEHGSAWLEVRKAGVYHFAGLRLPPGNYVVESPSNEGTFELRTAAGASLPSTGGRWQVASEADELDVVWIVTTEQVPLRVQSVSCRRQ